MFEEVLLNTHCTLERSADDKGNDFTVEPVGACLPNDVEKTEEDNM